jgi:hypothetical protein
MRAHTGALAAVALAAGLLTGCVERKYVITSDPPGALVLRNGQPIGVTPVDDHFIYYGNYKFTLIKDGYQTLQVDQEITTPWYQYFPIDFASENLVPCQISDMRRFHYVMEPVQAPQTDQLLQQAGNLRNRGRSLQPPPGTQGVGEPVQPAWPPPQPGAIPVKQKGPGFRRRGRTQAP